MINPAAIGIAILILFAVTTTVGSSSAKQDNTFKGSHPNLGEVLSDISLKDVMRSYQHQTNTIVLTSSALEDPHMLQIEVPSGATLQGQVLINNQIRLPLDSDLLPLDVSPYLQSGRTEVVITGTYNPVSASALIRFEGPDTLVQQQTAGTGEINYQLNLVVE
jgi:hypothetical protein